MKKRFALILSLLMLLSIFCSCGSKDSSYGGEQNPGNETSDDSQSDISKDAVSTEESPEKKIIKTYHLTLESTNFKEDAALIVSAAEALGGYISESSETNTSITDSKDALKYGTYTVRVPADKVEEYLETLRTTCNVLRSSLSTDDITDSYYDYQAKLDSLRLQEERLTAMLEKADSLDYMITLEDKLTEIRTEINAINSTLQLMDKAVNYSYVYLTLSEVKEYNPPSEESYWQHVGKTFVDAMDTFVDVMGGIFIVIIWISPFLLLGIIIAIVIVAVKHRKKKDKMKKGTDTSSDNDEKK